MKITNTFPNLVLLLNYSARSMYVLVCMYVCIMYVWMQVCVCKYACMYVCIYVCMYIMNLTISNFSGFITIHNVFAFVDSNSCVSVTNQNLTQVNMTLFSHYS
jgi:hypothetical protein